MRIRASAVVAILLAWPALAGAVSFPKVVGFATKTGFRGVIAWQASQPVAGRVLYRVNDGPERVALPIADLVDRAQIAVIDGLPTGATVKYRILDELSGDQSSQRTFVARNAYTRWNGSTYTIDALAQLDAEALPDGIPFDQGVEDLGRGMNVLAERIFDALDGKARLGTILITDTVLNHPVNVPFGPHAIIGDPLRAIGCAANRQVNGLGAVGHTLADFLVQTSIPFDSHTYSPWMINDPCTAFYIGRVGQLVIEWQDDLHLGYTMAHEFMHYAFNAPDLYPLNSTADCREPLPWDVSLMHNSGGWNGTKWELTEIDRQGATPCDHGNEPWTWTVARSRYTQLAANPGPPDSPVDTLCRGNPDGNALAIWILDQQPPLSTLRQFDPGDGGSCN